MTIPRSLPQSRYSPPFQLIFLDPAVGSGWPLSRTAGSAPSPPESELTLTAPPHAEAPAARGPLQARVRGARDSQGSDSGPLGQGPAARRALGAGHIPALDRALDLRGCTWGLSSLLLLPPCGAPAPPLPALTSPLSIRPCPPPPGEGGSGSPCSTAPEPRAPSRPPEPPPRSLVSPAVPAGLGARMV